MTMKTASECILRSLLTIEMNDVDCNPLTQASLAAKIKAQEGLSSQSFEDISKYVIPKKTYRNIEVRKASDLPKKKGLSFLSGKKRKHSPPPLSFNTF